MSWEEGRRRVWIRVSFYSSMTLHDHVHAPHSHADTSLTIPPQHLRGSHPTNWIHGRVARFRRVFSSTTIVYPPYKRLGLRYAQAMEAAARQRQQTYDDG